VTDAQTPHFDDLIDPDEPGRERLQAAHDLLVAAGPPPELPPSLQSPPQEPKPRVIPLPRRRYTAIAAVAIAACVLFGLGYAIGGRDKPQSPVKTIAMSGPAGATASILLQPIDAAGNWPMLLDVKGLPELPKGATYTLWLTRKGKLADPCGTFLTGAESSSIWLNAPYKLKHYDGWVVVRTGSTKPFLLRTDSV
jgi:hypothetical protein